MIALAMCEGNEDVLSCVVLYFFNPMPADAGEDRNMAFTWIAIIASLLMGIGALLIFIFAVKQDYFRDLEDAKYQVFWSDLEELVESSKAELPTLSEEDRIHGNGQENPGNRT